MALIAEKLKQIKASPTLSMTAKANELKRKNIDVISLSLGEPDFDTPENIKQAAIIGINQGHTKYTDIGGTIELKQAIRNKFIRENNLDYQLNEIMVSTGGKQVIYNAMTASLDAGDEVIIPAPYWVSYLDIVAMNGGTPVVVECGGSDLNFKISATLLEQAITDKTKWLFLNSPSNPTGAVYSKDELLSLGEVLLKHPHVHILSDDIYEHITFSEEGFYTIAELIPELKSRTLIVNGLSKGYAMTGWRLGYGAGPAELINAMTKVQSQSTSNTSSITQFAAIEALNGKQDFIKTNCDNFKKKRDLAVRLLNDINHIKCDEPDGAFYLFPECKELFGKKTPAGEIIKDGVDFANYLLEYAHVAIVPGVAFGLEGYFRFSYATSEELITKACSRIKEACSKLN